MTMRVMDGVNILIFQLFIDFMNYIDLGLPSGTKWADTNIGSFQPYEYGKLFTHKEAINLGVNIPTLTQLNELSSSCEREWLSSKGVNGCLFKGLNGNAIFLPAAGRIEIFGEYKGEGMNGFYWAADLRGISPNMAWMLMICNCFATTGCQNINRKHSVRSVL